MRSLLTLAGTPAAVGGGMTAMGHVSLSAMFVSFLAALAVAGFRAVASGDLV